MPKPLLYEAYVASKLADIIEQLEELEDYCVEIDLTPSEHKIQEGLGRLREAEEAANQAIGGGNK